MVYGSIERKYLDSIIMVYGSIQRRINDGQKHTPGQTEYLENFLLIASLSLSFSLSLYLSLSQKSSVCDITKLDITSTNLHNLYSIFYPFENVYSLFVFDIFSYITPDDVWIDYSVSWQNKNEYSIVNVSPMALSLNGNSDHVEQVQREKGLF